MKDKLGPTLTEALPDMHKTLGDIIKSLNSPSIPDEVKTKTEDLFKTLKNYLENLIDKLNSLNDPTVQPTLDKLKELLRAVEEELKVLKWVMFKVFALKYCKWFRFGLFSTAMPDVSTPKDTETPASSTQGAASESSESTAAPATTNTPEQ